MKTLRHSSQETLNKLLLGIKEIRTKVLEEENEKLRQENEKLKEEIENLKKGIRLVGI